MSENLNSRSSGVSNEAHNEPLKNRRMIEIKASNECYEKMPSMANKAKVENIVVKKGKDDISKSTLSAHEKFYVMNKMRKDNNKRRSFLPYKPNLLGIFTNMNGLSRSLHPF
uniref:Uncharacterized protein LOC101512356 n=1 Tax=Cicer arietinum TaxID=3827 RepID=A0A1S2YU00_CICAR|nr:uncharacterized protein LOC101512356 [Cicer arietinum]